MADQWLDDQFVLTMLRDALWGESDVPPEVLDAGHTAYAWRNIDGELASLTYDSTTEDLALSGARSQQAGLRAMTLVSSSVTIELEVVGSVLLGQVVPPRGSEILVSLQSGASTVVPVDELGCFTIAPLPHVRFRLQLDGEPNITTDWIGL